MFLIWVLAAAIPITSAAQTLASVVGAVVDSTGAALADAEVTVIHLGTGAIRRMVTNADGRFSFTGLVPGEYDVRATRSGFRSALRPRIALSVGEQATLALTLQVGASEAVTVNGDATTTNRRTPELSYLVDQQTIARLPLNGRNFTDLLSLQPMVNPFAHRDNGSVVAHGLAMSVNGQDPRANVYLIDGTLLNDFTNGPAGSAAGTALGLDTIQEFRIESSVYSAEFGRGVGGQINVITKSGSNQPLGSAFLFHRNDRLDARNYFNTGDKPSFRRNQFGGTFGGPIRRNKVFFFGGYEALAETLGRAILTTVPDDDAREGRLPGGVVVPIDPAVLPYVREFPRANGERLGGGLASHAFDFTQKLIEHFLQARTDVQPQAGTQWFLRYTLDDAEERLPTDYPQFPRAFVSTNHFVTSEFRHVVSQSWVYTARVGLSLTRIGQEVEANTSQPVGEFVPGRGMMGAIDIGGLPRFGPQSSVNVRLRQSVASGQFDLLHGRGRHLFKAGALAEQYVDDERNPTFSLGIFRFANLASFLRNQPASFIGLTPSADFERRWNWTMFAAYVQEEYRLGRGLTLNAGVRFETTTLPREQRGRDVSMPDLMAPAPTVGPLYRNPSPAGSPRAGIVWDIGGRGTFVIRGGYGLYFNINNQQNLIVTVTNPPATPRVVLANPSFPVPSFDRPAGISVRPIQFDVVRPSVQMWNINVQHELGAGWTAMAGYAGSRGRHLWRNSDLNVPAPTTLPDGTVFYAPGLTRPNRAFSAIEVKSSDGDSWYRALILDVRRQWRDGWQLQSSYTWSKAEDTTQNSTFFSDSTTATTSAMPEFIPDYNKGLADFHAEHQWSATLVWEGLGGWRFSGAARVRSGQPLTPFVQTNRSRSLWSPSLGPGTGPDRPSYAPGRGPGDAVLGRPDRWFDPTAFVLQPAGTFGTVRRNELIGPGLATLDLAASRRVRWTRLGSRGSVELRFEVFNVFNRANLGAPSLIAFAGTSDGEPVLSSFGQIRTTITPGRQAQLGMRLSF